MRFAPWSTAAYAALWLAVVAQGWGPLLGDDPMLRLHYPDSAAERLTNRDLELAEAIDHSPPLERRILGALYGTRDEALEVAIDTQREVLASGSREDPPEALEIATDEVRARLAVLLAEAGRPDEADELLREHPVHQPLLDLLAGSPGRTEEEARDLLYAAGLFDWYADRALLRVVGSESARVVQADLLERGGVWKQRSLTVFGASLLLVILGGLLLVPRIRFLPELLRGVGGAPPWTLETGIGVFVRGDFWNRLCFLALAWVWTQPFGAVLAESPIGTFLQTWVTLIASLPLLWLVHRHLLAPLDLSATRSFGLDVPMISVLRVALCAISIDLLGTHALAWSAWGLELSSSWAEGFDEMLVWGDRGEALLSAADYILWAPAMEELAFRGLLYYSLRHRLSPLTAAIVTAGFFSALHFYSLPGFLMTFWSGLVWALAFERLRSLLPGIGAHAVYNGLFVAGLVLVYR